MAELWESLGVRPELARTLARHVAAVNGGSIAPRVRELCALMVAWLNACESCTETHADMARALGVDRETLDELGNFARSERYAPAERAALSAAVALTREPRGLPDAVREALAQHYDAGEIVEIVAAIGLNNYITRVSNALRTATLTG